jgi:hypothetical protein
MTTLWYSINIQNNGQTIFLGYLNVNSNNTVLGLFETINGTTNFSNNELGPLVFPPPNNFYTADTFFNNTTLLFTVNIGINFTSSNLQSVLSDPSPYFNIYTSTDLINILWQSGDITNNITIVRVSDPTGRITMQFQNQPNYIEFTNSVALGVNLSNKMPVLSRVFSRFPKNLLFSDNSLVVYKPHSLAPGGVGTVKNSRAKSFKT